MVLNTDFYLTPEDAGNEIDGIEGQPYTAIQIFATRSSERFDVTIPLSVQITGLWGWSGVPNAVKQATFIQASRLFKRKDAPFNVYGSEQTGTFELFSKFDPDALKLITNYRKIKL